MFKYGASTHSISSDTVAGASDQTIKVLIGSLAKRLFDLSLAATVLVLSSPFFALLLLLLLLADGYPLFFRHKRIGLGGRSFDCLKLRTMRVDGDEVLRLHFEAYPSALIEWQSARKLKNDPRISPLGSILRRSSLDELPQLLNILRGEMSFVGPRPIVDDEKEIYGSSIQQYFQVKPGLTGLWQISGRSDTSYDERIALDCAYVSSRSFLKDLSILAKTCPVVLSRKGTY